MLFSMNHEKGLFCLEKCRIIHHGFSTMTRAPWVREEGILFELSPHHNQSDR